MEKQFRPIANDVQIGSMIRDLSKGLEQSQTQDYRSRQLVAANSGQYHSISDVSREPNKITILQNSNKDEKRPIFGSQGRPDNRCIDSPLKMSPKSKRYLNPRKQSLHHQQPEQ